ncbi:MAG: dTDP-glucose pyrophosphorylase, partial [Gammaproteobacteria bacterium]
MSTKNDKYIGLIPAAGNAARLQKYLQGSKEIYPFSFRGKKGVERSFPVCKCLLDSFHEAGIDKTYIVLKEGKEDIPEKLGKGEEYGVEINYLYTKPTFG